jgi:hypothetical protein
MKMSPLGGSCDSNWGLDGETTDEAKPARLKTRFWPALNGVLLMPMIVEELTYRALSKI